MNPTIEILIAPDGTSRLETKGFNGPACREASRQLEQALGLRTAEHLKGEFHQAATTSQPLRQAE